MTELEFDPGVGTESTYSKELKLQADFAQAQAEASVLLSLKASPGWKLVESFINDVIAADTDKLITERDLDLIRRHQETIQAFLKVLHFPDIRISQAEELRKAPSDDPTALSPDPSEDPAG